MLAILNFPPTLRIHISTPQKTNKTRPGRARRRAAMRASRNRKDQGKSPRRLHGTKSTEPQVPKSRHHPESMRPQNQQRQNASVQQTEGTPHRRHRDVQRASFGANTDAPDTKRWCVETVPVSGRFPIELSKIRTPAMGRSFPVMSLGLERSGEHRDRSGSVSVS